MRGDSKVESYDSPEIPDRGETADIPGLPSGEDQEEQTLTLLIFKGNTEKKYF